jgi:hypothetical protein
LKISNIFRQIFWKVQLCKLYKVNEKYYDSSTFVKDKKKKVDREVDFYLKNDIDKYKCEIKLMGMGNPESADSMFARQPSVFVADKLSQQNINQAEQLGIIWVELNQKNGFRRFKSALEKFKIPHKEYKGDLDMDLPKILNELF